VAFPFCWPSHAQKGRLMRWMVTHQTAIARLQEYVPTMKKGRPYTLDIRLWYKPRTTGKNTQNPHIHGHATQIGAEIGETKRAVIREAQERAVTKRYPTRLNKFGRVIPMPEEELDTRGANILIKELHDMAAFLGIRLIEGDAEKLADVSEDI